MMIGSETLRWLLTPVFAAAALAAVLPLRAPVRTAARADRAGAGFCLAMCAAMAVMTWLPEPAAAVWVQAAGFGCAGLWFGLGRRGGSGWFRRPSLTGLHHALMAAAMIWMLAAVPGVARMAGTGRTAGMAGMQPPGRGQGAMAAMATMGLPVPVLAVSTLAAACCVIAAVPWLARAVGPGLRVTDPAAAGNALMSAGMAAMLIAML